MAVIHVLSPESALMIHLRLAIAIGVIPKGQG
jgi:hypothetical protein